MSVSYSETFMLKVVKTYFNTGVIKHTIMRGWNKITLDEILIDISPHER